MKSIVENLPSEFWRVFLSALSFCGSGEMGIRTNFQNPPPPSRRTYLFAKYRLVSKQWKWAADAFFFREIAIRLNLDPSHSEDGSQPNYYPKGISRPSCQSLKRNTFGYRQSRPRAIPVPLNPTFFLVPLNEESLPA